MSCKLVVSLYVIKLIEKIASVSKHAILSLYCPLTKVLQKQKPLPQGLDGSYTCFELCMAKLVQPKVEQLVQSSCMPFMTGYDLILQNLPILYRIGLYAYGP